MLSALSASRAAAAVAAKRPRRAPSWAQEHTLGNPACRRPARDVMRSPTSPPKATAKPASSSHLRPAADQSVGWLVLAVWSPVITVPTAKRYSPLAPCPSTPVASHWTW